MGSKAAKLILTIFTLMIVGGAYFLVDEYCHQKFIEGFREGQEDYKDFCIYVITSLTLSDIRFHSKVALNSLERDSAGAFNLSMVELKSDFMMLGWTLVESAMYLFPDEFPDNKTLANMTETYHCFTFVELSQKAFLNGTANVSAVREGLILIHDFATEWRGSHNYPSEELLKANAELQRKCGELVQRVKAS